jgi:hypothetical protein
MDKTISRRAAFMVPVGLFFGSLVGCQAVSTAIVKLPQWAQDAQTIGGALGKVAGVIGTIQGVPATVIATVQDAVATVQRLAGEIGSTASTATSTAGSAITGLVSGFGSAVTRAIGSIAGISVPSWVSTALSAAATLLPTILQVAGVVLAGPGGVPDPQAVAASRAYLVALAA